MLNDSILLFCKYRPSDCHLCPSSTFKVIKFQRLENVEMFEAYKYHEVRVAQKTQNFSRPGLPGLPTWLQKLTEKNGLSQTANNMYLLHGTSKANLVSTGLKIAARNRSTCGRGLYFIPPSLQSKPICSPRRSRTLCRVVHGKMEDLVQRKAAPNMDIIPHVARQSLPGLNADTCSRTMNT